MGDGAAYFPQLRSFKWPLYGCAYGHEKHATASMIPYDRSGIAGVRRLGNCKDLLWVEATFRRAPLFDFNLDMARWPWYLEF